MMATLPQLLATLLSFAAEQQDNDSRNRFGCVVLLAARESDTKGQRWRIEGKVWLIGIPPCSALRLLPAPGVI